MSASARWATPNGAPPPAPRSALRQSQLGITLHITAPPHRSLPNALALSIGALLASSMGLLVLVRVRRDVVEAWRAWRAHRATRRQSAEFAALSAIEFEGGEAEGDGGSVSGSEAGLMRHVDDEGDVLPDDEDRGLIAEVQQMALAIGSAAMGSFDAVGPADPDARATPVAPHACAGWGAAPGPVISAWTPVLHE